MAAFAHDHARAPSRTPAPPADRLVDLLGEAAARDPHAAFIRDQPNRAAWTSRPGRDVDRADSLAAIRRLAGFLRNLPLEAGARIGICLPNGVEATLSILAAEAAGLAPCLLDVCWTASELSAAIEAADIRAAITQGILGPERPAATLCFVAAGFLRLRFLMGFGPGLPRGVTDLGAVLDDRTRDGAPGHAPAAEVPDIVTFGRDVPRPIPLPRSASSLIASTAAFIAATHLQPSERIVTLIAPDDLAGLALGPIAALVAGASVEAHGTFDAAALMAAVDGPAPVHLVVPGWMGKALGDAGIAARVRSMVLVHRAPARLDRDTPLRGHVVDVLALGETALLTGGRQNGRPGLTLRPGMVGFVETHVDSGGTIRVRGPGVAGQPDDEGWVGTGFTAAGGTGRVTEILRCEP